MTVERATTTWAPGFGALKDYASLAKPRTVMLHLLTAAAAMLLAARGAPPASLLLCTLGGGGLVAAASNVLNCYFDRDLDALMPRTRQRPLPAGRIPAEHALAFGAITGAAGFAILLQWVGIPEALLSGGALLHYVFVYTLWLKHRTRWSAVAGSAAGAVPPLVGWMAVTGRVSPAPLLLFAIVAVWTLPHFWSLAICRRTEYESAGLTPAPAKRAWLWITTCAISLLALTLLLGPVAGLGHLYMGSAALLGAALLCLALDVRRSAPASAKRLYVYSIIYLVAVFAAMMVDRLR